MVIRSAQTLGNIIENEGQTAAMLNVSLPVS